LLQDKGNRVQKYFYLFEFFLTLHQNDTLVPIIKQHMSQLLRKALKAEKPAAFQPTLVEEDEDEDEDATLKQTTAYDGNQTNFVVPKPRTPTQDKALAWDTFFTTLRTIDGIATYTCGTTGPYVLLLHGAGHTAMSWALVSVRYKLCPTASSPQPLLLVSSQGFLSSYHI